MKMRTKRLLTALRQLDEITSWQKGQCVVTLECRSGSNRLYAYTNKARFVCTLQRHTSKRSFNSIYLLKDLIEALEAVGGLISINPKGVYHFDKAIIGPLKTDENNEGTLILSNSSKTVLTGKELGLFLHFIHANIKTGRYLHCKGRTCEVLDQDFKSLDWQKLPAAFAQEEWITELLPLLDTIKFVPEGTNKLSLTPAKEAGGLELVCTSVTGDEFRFTSPGLVSKEPPHHAKPKSSSIVRKKHKKSTLSGFLRKLLSKSPEQQKRTEFSSGENSELKLISTEIFDFEEQACEFTQENPEKDCLALIFREGKIKVVENGEFFFLEEELLGFVSWNEPTEETLLTAAQREIVPNIALLMGQDKIGVTLKNDKVIFVGSPSTAEFVYGIVNKVLEV